MILNIHIYGYILLYGYINKYYNKGDMLGLTDLLNT